MASPGSYGFFGAPLDAKTLSDFTSLSPSISQHLVQVYRTLCLTILSAAAGSVSYIYGFLPQSIASFSLLIGMGLLIWLGMTPATPRNVGNRTLMLYGVGFINGVSISPLIERALDVDSALLFIALVGTALIFTCFSVAALLAKNRSFLYLGGLLSSAVSLLFWLGLANLFFHSRAIFNIELYVGLIVFCGFVVFDTQLVVAKAMTGDRDHIRHSLMLFVDLIAIFVRVLIILMKNQESKKERRERRRDE